MAMKNFSFYIQCVLMFICKLLRAIMKFVGKKTL